jgi:hypothetical protein
VTKEDKPNGEDDIPPTGGYHVAKNKTYDLLAKACQERNIIEAQRLALMVLSWWNGHNHPMKCDSEEYQRIEKRIMGNEFESPAQCSKNDWCIMGASPHEKCFRGLGG